MDYVKIKIKNLIASWCGELPKSLIASLSSLYFILQLDHTFLSRRRILELIKEKHIEVIMSSSKNCQMGIQEF